jgi:cell envelope-related function transcriptional attenuator common domain
MHYINVENSSASAIPGTNKTNSIFTPYTQIKEPFNLLILGGDKVSFNSDTMMLMNFDPSTMKINVMSIPRDTKTRIKNNIHKINYAYPNGGVELTAQTVSELLDVNIKYYVFVDTTSFRKIIDILGGVQIDVPVDLDYDDPTQDLHIHLKKGLQILDGDKAEQFVRFRHPNHWTKEVKQFYDGSDLKRIEYQQMFINELIKQKLTIQYIPKLNNIINLIFQNIETNFTLNEVLKLSGYATKFNTQDINFIPMPGTPYDASPWYYLCDVEKSREIISQQFICSESFVTIDNENKDYYINGNINSEKTNTKTASSGKKSTTKNNPSNTDSNLSGKQTPAP